MTFAVSERVAQLWAGNDFRGTAWLISDTFALTARHCVAVDDVLLEELTLRFPIGGAVRVTLHRHDEVRDIALLEVAPDNVAAVPPGRVVALARRTEAVNTNRVEIVGYPGETVALRKSAFVVHGHVVNPKVALMRDPRPIYAQVSPSSVNGAGHEALMGMSGSPVFDQSDAQGGETYAFGIALEVPAMGNIDIIPIAALLDWEEVSAAYAASPHTPRGPLCLHLEEPGVVAWSAGVPPQDISQYWGGVSPVTAISCRASRQELGEELWFALLRLAGHSKADCAVRDEAEWKAELAPVPTDRMPPIRECDGGHGRHRPEEMGAPVTPYRADNLAETIHRSLDQFLLGEIDRQLKQVLGGTPPFGAPKVETLLAGKMLALWRKEWFPTLQNDPLLLRTVLVRLAWHLDEVSPARERILLVGPGLSPDTFWRPCLFALALAAAGISLNFAMPDRGNMLLAGGAAGHACGCERVRNETLARLLGRNQWWSVALVLLPLMAEPYLGRFKKMVDMTHSSDRPRIGERPPPPPVVVTGDADFEDALEGGAAALIAHVTRLRDELAHEISRLYDERRASEWKSQWSF